MANVVIVGMQWGDEGKGKIVDLLCPAFPCVARYQGGHNAGHTVKFEDQHFALHLIPSGILHDGTQCYLCNGMVISPRAFLSELEGLHAAGVDTEGRLHISDRAHVLLLAHQAVDHAREETAGENKIGTTSRGIGPAYENKYARFGLRMIDLMAGDLEDRLAPQLHRIESDLRGMGASFSPTLLQDTIAACEEIRPQLRPYMCDVSLELNRAIDEGKAVLFEGAQGTLLDVDHGTFPFVTSSNSTSGGATIGTGVPPNRIDGTIGILKAYSTRVGEGPFPTELLDDTGEHLRARGHEFGTTTGRPRRCGWLDIVVARYAQRVNGIGSIALTKLDVLDQVAEIEVCVGYRIDGETITDFPADTRVLDRVEPIYKTMKGWQQDTVGTLEVKDLPPAARDYVEFIEQEVGAEVGLVSTGPRREETIVTPQPTLRAWLGDGLPLVTAQLGG
jgi:adenylosuccinate synthase